MKTLKAFEPILNWKPTKKERAERRERENERITQRSQLGEVRKIFQMDKKEKWQYVKLIEKDQAFQLDFIKLKENYLNLAFKNKVRR
jgi:hypothetical protein